MTNNFPRPYSTTKISFSLCLAALVVQAFAMIPVIGQQNGKNARSPVKLLAFRSGDKDIAVEHFGPANATGKSPVLVVFHAVDGLDEMCGPFYREAAGLFANKGYLVLLVHYFDRTGSQAADLRGYRDLFFGYFRKKEHKAEDTQRIKALLQTWSEVVRDAVAYARTLPHGDPSRIGLVGFSLGATLVLHAATQQKLEVAALVEFFGALPPDGRPRVNQLPPLLIFHGEVDGVVPVEQAYVLVGLLVTRKRPPEATVFPGVDHMFFKKDGKTLDRWSFLMAGMQTQTFLDKHLKKEAMVAR
jgi:dienelactone hydrolase